MWSLRSQREAAHSTFREPQCFRARAGRWCGDPYGRANGIHCSDNPSKREGDDISLAFTKVLDRVTLATDEEESYEITDRNYWENQSTSKMMKNVDLIFDSMI